MRPTSSDAHRNPVLFTRNISPDCVKSNEKVNSTLFFVLAKTRPHGCPISEKERKTVGVGEITTKKARMHLLVFAALLASVAAGPTLYNIDKEAGTAERVMVPVSSTVIPLEELPETQVGFGFGIANKGHHIKKPAYLKVR